VSYAAFSLVFLAVSLVPAGLVLVRRTARAPGTTWWRSVLVTMMALVVLTVIFDSLMVSVDLFTYDQARSLGIDVVLTPLEDLAWPVASAVLLPSLWALALRRGAPRPAPRQPRPSRDAPSPR
jgi:lycopene cyclase domain-containing protein